MEYQLEEITCGIFSNEEMEDQESKEKTQLCYQWRETGKCKYGKKCKFAHGEEELRPIKKCKKYKTEECKHFRNGGVCKHGEKCDYIHKKENTKIELYEIKNVIEILEGNNKLNVFNIISEGISQNQSLFYTI